jgi:hypothetical protein
MPTSCWLALHAASGIVAGRSTRSLDGIEEPMSRKIAVHFDESVGRLRALNFAEDVDRELQRTGAGTAINPESITAAVFRVELAASRRLGDVKRIIDTTAGRHNLRDQITVAQEK